MTTIQKMAPLVEAVYCPNIRGGPQFSAAGAYENWYDLSRQEVMGLLADLSMLIP